ncbi:MAG: ABC transporter permease [Bellilinea sp.]|jgi:ABC-type nitrate/sulfonate/bicarbonate transport system permease component
MNPARRQFSPAGIALAMIAAFFVFWELAVVYFAIPVYLLPAPSRVLSTLADHPLLYAEATLITLGEAVGGLLLGVLAGVLLASLLVLLPGIEDGVMMIAILMKSTPLVAIAPLLTLWLGFGVLPKILITALMTFFPVLVNVLSGLQKVDAHRLELFHSWHASQREIFRHLRAPSALPYLFAALKISAPLALIGAVVAEWTGASGGLGRTMWLAYTNLNLPFLFAAIFILAAAGMLFYRLTILLERKVVFWQSHNDH